MNQVMVCLVGEQPVPNLLPIRFLSPKQVVLVHSDFTKRVSENLEQLLKGRFTVHLLEVSPYDIDKVVLSIDEFLSEKGWNDLVFNLTGGTKPMSLAAFLVAQKQGADVAYLQSQGGQSLLYSYDFDKAEPILRERTIIGESLTIDDYLKVHGLGNYHFDTQREPFQQLVFEALKPYVSEVAYGVKYGGSLDIDLIIRCGNQVGIAEVKSGKAAERKSGIDQLNTASQRDFLGTYTRRFLIADRPLGSNNSELAKAHNILAIELMGDHATGLSRKNIKHLVQSVTSALGKRP
jgi:hypothetical protein